MSASKHRLITFLIPPAVLLLGGALLVWPNYRERQQVESDIAILREKIRTSSVQAEMVESLTQQRDALRDQLDADLKQIPESHNTASLMGKLSLTVDGVSVKDQSFNSGKPQPALEEEQPTAFAMPLTIDLEASFDSVFALLQLAEADPRLIRVNSVHLSSNRGDVRPTQRGSSSSFDEGLLSATVSMEAIYEPVNPGSEH